MRLAYLYMSLCLESRLKRLGVRSSGLNGCTFHAPQHEGSLSYLDLWPDSPDGGEILRGKRVLIVVRVSLSGGIDATLILHLATG